MEVKIGVQHAPREIVFESKATLDELEATVAEALSSRTLFTAQDDRGGLIVVPADKIAYVEIGTGSERRLGFGVA